MPRVRNHVNPLKLETWARESLVLPSQGEVEVELGCADAQFLFQRAALAPARVHIGIEIRVDLVHDVNLRATTQGLTNLRAVFANINRDLDRLLPDGRVQRIFINFPDPWFKRRHHKRRLLTPELAAAIERKLAVSGQLLFQSDVWELALDAMAVLESTDGLVNQRGAWSFLPDHDFGARSLREVRCAAKGLHIWRMLYRRL